LYGTTFSGGSGGQCNFGCGTIFKATTGGTLTTLYSFGSRPGAPQYPYGGLVLGTDGNFYGTSATGGTNNACSDSGIGSGCGTVLRVTAGGTPTRLYNFCSQTNCADGSLPYAALVQGTDGSFYGTTIDGGSTTCEGGCGTVFKITVEGRLTTLYSFCAQANCPDGDSPYGALVQGNDGDFYGTTIGGGANGSGGTVFKITPEGTLTTLYSFCSQANCTDGQGPVGGLVQGAEGSFYGTTYEGGVKSNGTVFRITTAGTLTTLHNFCSRTNCADGSQPQAGLALGTDGSFYGTTYQGGAKGGGTVFKITSGGMLTTLYSFCSQANCTDGVGPLDSPMQATDGNFYGTTYGGGPPGDGGTVFSLSVGLSPFVKTNPTSGKAGKSVMILGSNLTGTTGVSFNGTAATFTVVSSTEITATVPAGATTGAVQVTTPGGTLQSNVTFRVTP
jgi:uncharacterized repeat protein (TIGR03803 family)